MIYKIDDYGYLNIEDLETKVSLTTSNTIRDYLKARLAISLIKDHVIINFKELYEYVED
jgi:hypothetical protein